MPTRVEVFADITCPFAHVGLKHIAAHVATSGRHVDIVVRAWPLEWVNGAPLDVDAVLVKAAALTEQLGVDDFTGLRADRWPSSTLPGLALAAGAYAHDAATGLAASLGLRRALFEDGLDVSDPDVLATIAAGYGIEWPLTGSNGAVEADYAAGQARGVKGSPHFFVADDDFFCPALDLGHDSDGHLTARFDSAQLTEFFARIGV